MTCEKCNSELTLEIERDQAVCVECQKRAATAQMLASAIGKAIGYINRGHDANALQELVFAHSIYVHEIQANSGEKPLFDEA